MKKQGKKISSFILVLAMILTMIPMAGAVAFAESEPAAFTGTEKLYHEEEFNEEHVADYLITAPAAALWTFTKNSGLHTMQNYELNTKGESNRYLVLRTYNNSQYFKHLQRSGEAKKYTVAFNNQKALIYYEVPFLSNYNYLNSSFALSEVSKQSNIQPFGYLFDSDGKLVSSDFSAGNHILVSAGNYLSYEKDDSGYKPVSTNTGIHFVIPCETDPEVEVKEGLVYNATVQEIFSCDERMVVTDVTGPAAYVQGTTTVGAINAGSYTITFKPAEGYFWSDWTTDAKQVSVEIDRQPAKIELVLPVSINYLDPVPSAVISQTGIYEEDFEALNVSFEAFALGKAIPGGTVQLTPGAAMPYYHKNCLISYYIVFDDSDIISNYNMKGKSNMYAVKVNPIALTEKVISEDTYPVYNGQMQEILSWNEHVELVTVNAIEGSHWMVSGNALYATEALPYDTWLKPENGYAWSFGGIDEQMVERFICSAVAFMFAVPAEDTAYYKGTVPEATVSFAGVIGNDADLLDPVLKIYNDADPNTALQPGDTVELHMGTLVYELENTTSAAFDNFFVNYVLYPESTYVPVEVNEYLVEDAKVVTGATISGTAVGTTTATIELVFVSAENSGEEAREAAAQAEHEFEKLDADNKVRIVKTAVEVELCIKEGDTLTKVENAEVLGEALDVYIPYAWDSAKEYEVAHWNGNTLDNPIKADKVLLTGGARYLHFKASRFSPYVVMEVHQAAQPEPVKEVVYVGGGTSAPSKYAVNVKTEGQGTYELSDKKAAAGELVTIKPSAGENYTLKKISVVTDKNGTVVPYTEKDGSYTFVMPSEATTITLTFAEKPAVDVLAPYNDINMKAWYVPSIRFCVENNYANGTSATSFEPTKPLSKLEVITMLWKMAGQPKADAVSSANVPAGKWYTEPVLWAISKNIISDSPIKPSYNASRQEVSTMLYRYIQSLGGGFKGLYVYNLAAPDKADIASWAFEAVAYLNMKQIMEGDGNGNLNPLNTMTRAEMCALIKKFSDADIITVPGSEQLELLEPVVSEPIAIEPEKEPEEPEVIAPWEEPARPQFEHFTDLKKGEWYETAISFCLDKGYANGVSETRFAASAKLTRAEVVTMLWKMAGQPVVNYAISIPDVASGTWYLEAVRWAASCKIISGTNAFNPGAYASRQEVATMLYRYIQYKGAGYEGLYVYNMDVSDKDQIASWAFEACLYLNMKNIMTGTDGKLNPTKLMTRAEMCAMIYKYANQ